MSEWLETEFGSIPISWTYSPLENFFELITYGFTNPMPTTNEGPFMLTAKDIYNGKINYAEARKTSREAYENKLTSKSKPRLNDVLITKDGSTGRVAIVDKENICISQSVALIRPNNRIRPLFLKYLLETDYYQKIIDIDATGSTIKHIYITKINKMNIGVPDLKVQDQIVECIHSIQTKIDLLHRNNKTLEQLAETFFRQWFVEEADDSWEKKTLGELVKVVDNRGKTPVFTGNKTDFPVIEVNALNGESRYIDYSKMKKYVDSKTYETWFRAGHPKLNDILFSTVGSVGEMSMMLRESGTIAQNVVALRAEKISPYYLYQYLLSIQDEIKEFDIGSVQPSIKVTHLTKIEIPIPDQNRINSFDKQLNDICQKISINYDQMQQLESLRDTLLPKLMSGVVRVAN